MKTGPVRVRPAQQQYILRNNNIQQQQQKQQPQQPQQQPQQPQQQQQ